VVDNDTDTDTAKNTPSKCYDIKVQSRYKNIKLTTAVTLLYTVQKYKQEDVRKRRK